LERNTDEQLLDRYRQGDEKAFRALIERYHDDLMRFLVRLTGDRQAAEDVFQETFLQVHLSADKFDPTRRFKPWLFTIAANKGRDMLRKKSRRQTMDLSAPVGGNDGGGGGGAGDGNGVTFVDLMEIDVPAPDAALDAQERDQMVQQALGKLAHPLREILLLAYFQRLSYIQIAEELGIPLGTVKSRLHAAVAAFAKAWSTVSQGSSNR
jgi:RNA polymerase sigma-70 factor (ECF subfamily)